MKCTDTRLLTRQEAALVMLGAAACARAIAYRLPRAATPTGPGSSPSLETLAQAKPGRGPASVDWPSSAAGLDDYHGRNVTQAYKEIEWERNFHIRRASHGSSAP